MCIIGWLWFRLISHLQVFWATSPQYGYGYVVPFLCGFLFWERSRAFQNSRSTAPHTSLTQLSSRMRHWLVIACALIFGIIRIFAEANPDWRLVSWALALDTIVLTLLLFPEFERWLEPRQTNPLGIGLPRLSRSGFFLSVCRGRVNCRILSFRLSLSLTFLEP